jgi:hypothetical protein
MSEIIRARETEAALNDITLRLRRPVVWAMLNPLRALARAADRLAMLVW